LRIWILRRLGERRGRYRVRRRYGLGPSAASVKLNGTRRWRADILFCCVDRDFEDFGCLEHFVGNPGLLAGRIGGTDDWGYLMTCGYSWIMPLNRSWMSQINSAVFFSPRDAMISIYNRVDSGGKAGKSTLRLYCKLVLESRGLSGAGILNAITAKENL